LEASALASGFFSSPPVRPREPSGTVAIVLAGFASNVMFVA
jgi:hypothetical protein